jgi:putative redox protein
MAAKSALVRHVKGITFLGKAGSNHWIPMDGPAEFGGMDSGARPKELILIGLGGCTASDVASILEKKRVPFTQFDVQLTAKEAEEHPKVFTEIHIEYVVYGKGIRKEDVERAIELSVTKYCSVSAMLKASVKLTHSYRIVEPQ